MWMRHGVQPNEVFNEKQNPHLALRHRQDSAFRKMGLNGGVGPDGEFTRLGQCELIWTLAEIRVTNRASLQIAKRVH